MPGTCTSAVPAAAGVSEYRIVRRNRTLVGEEAEMTPIELVLVGVVFVLAIVMVGALVVGARVLRRVAGPQPA